MTRAEQRKRYRQVYREQTAQERYWQPIIKGALDRMLVPVYRSLRDFGIAITINNINSLILPGGLGNVIERLYMRSGTMAANSEYGFIMDTYGEELRMQKAFGFNRIFADLMRNFFAVFGGQNIQSIVETERKRVRAVLVLAAEEALDPRETARLLRSGDINVVRSRLISRTELSIAMNKGSFEGAKRTGVVLDKVWIATLDNRTRRMPRDQVSHIAMNNVTIPYSAMFEVPSKMGVIQMSHPGDPSAPPSTLCNCRCRSISQARRSPDGRILRV